MCLVTVGATFGVIEWQKRQASVSSTGEPESEDRRSQDQGDQRPDHR